MSPYGIITLAWYDPTPVEKKLEKIRSKPGVIDVGLAWLL